MVSSDIPTPHSSISIQVLRRVPWLVSVSDAALEQMRLRFRRRSYARGETIVRRGVRGGFLGIVETGEAAIISRTPGGRTFAAPLRPGESFVLADDVRSAVTIQAITAVTLWTLNQADVVDFRSPSPALQSTVIQTPKSHRQVPSRGLARRLELLRLVLVLLIVVLSGVVAMSSTGQALRADVRYARGLRYLEEQQLEAAERQFNAALKLNPAHAASYNSLGYIYDQQGKGEEALRAFEHAATLNADSDVIQNNLGVVRAHFGMTDVALANLQRAAELGINTSAIYVNLGNLYVSLGDWLNAGRAYREALRMNPRLAVTHYNLGFVYYRQRQFANAYGEFKRALEFDPNLAVAYVGLGVLDFEQGDLAAARTAFLRATELSSQDAVAYFYLGLTEKVLGEMVQSAAAFEQVLDLAPAPSLIREQAERHLQEFRH